MVLSFLGKIILALGFFLPGFLHGLSSTESKSNSCIETPLTVPTASTLIPLPSFPMAVLSLTEAAPVPGLKVQLLGVV